MLVKARNYERYNHGIKIKISLNSDIQVSQFLQFWLCSENSDFIPQILFFFFFFWYRIKKNCHFLSYNSEFSWNCEFISNNSEFILWNSDFFSHDSHNSDFFPFFTSCLSFFHQNSDFFLQLKVYTSLSFLLRIMTLYLTILRLYYAIVTFFLEEWGKKKELWYINSEMQEKSLNCKKRSHETTRQPRMSNKSVTRVLVPS